MLKHLRSNDSSSWGSIYEGIKEWEAELKHWRWLPGSSALHSKTQHVLTMYCMGSKAIKNLRTVKCLRSTPCCWFYFEAKMAWFSLILESVHQRFTQHLPMWPHTHQCFQSQKHQLLHKNYSAFLFQVQTTLVPCFPHLKQGFIPIDRCHDRRTICHASELEPGCIWQRGINIDCCLVSLQQHVGRCVSSQHLGPQWHASLISFLLVPLAYLMWGKHTASWAMWRSSREPAWSLQF